MSEDIRKEFAYIDFGNKQIGGVLKAKNWKKQINSLRSGDQEHSFTTPTVNPNSDLHLKEGERE